MRSQVNIRLVVGRIFGQETPNFNDPIYSPYYMVIINFKKLLLAIIIISVIFGVYNTHIPG